MAKRPKSIFKDHVYIKPGPKPEPKKRGRPKLNREPKLKRGRPRIRLEDRPTEQGRKLDGTFTKVNKYSSARDKIGRPRSGRAAALSQLDSILGEARSLGRLRADFRLMLAADPTLFFKDIVMPLLPREAILSLFGGEDEKKPIRIVFQPVTGDNVETTISDPKELLSEDDVEDYGNDDDADIEDEEEDEEDEEDD